MSYLLEIYHRYIEHAVGGLGPFIALIVLLLLVFVPVTRWEAKMSRSVGPVLASHRTSWIATAGFLVILLVAIFFGSHP